MKTSLNDPEDARRMAEIEDSLTLKAPAAPVRQTSNNSSGSVTTEIDALASAAAASIPVATDARAREWAETQRRIAERKRLNQEARRIQSEKNEAIVARLEADKS